MTAGTSKGVVERAVYRATDKGMGRLLRFDRRRSLLARLGLQKDDWVAIPVCLLWAIGMVLWSATSTLRLVPGNGYATADSAVSIVLAAADALSTPAALLRHLIG
jgi:hypothetical protein